MEQHSRIDRETVQKILDTADIVEVVSDFVTLKRSGANYVGLCPFHNERTPSFSVSRSKGICKCFSCGKGGSPVNFIMEIEQMTYPEALRYLARKYHIEIKEKELTPDEAREQSERQAMLAVNDWAMAHFRHNLTDTADGRDIGLTYFRQRGINDWAIERFSLGYSLDKRDDLLSAAHARGHRDQYLEAVGLVSRGDHGEPYDRFRARVMYPVMNVAGRVVAFGGRTLRTDKAMAKYVNSPESAVYSKSRELYGLFQAKGAIAKKNQCILVEGYMDVISMHQRGIENVVASSGTSLTEGQTRLIHRFTENVLLVYDGDAAGIKAMLRGVDILLAEGLNIKVLLLPPGEDPDSFAQAHSATEIEQYIAQRQQDVIRFKSEILLRDSANDPIARAKAIGSIVASIAAIPSEITRSVYTKETSLLFGIDEQVLARQVAVDLARLREEKAKAAQRRRAVESIDHGPGVQQAGAGQASSPTPASTAQSPQTTVPVAQTTAPVAQTAPAQGSTAQGIAAQGVSAVPATRQQRVLEPQERALLRLLVKYGLLELPEDFGTGIDGHALKVLDFAAADLQADGLTFLTPAYLKVYNALLQLHAGEYAAAAASAEGEALQLRKRAETEGLERISQTAQTSADIRREETLLKEHCEEVYRDCLRQFRLGFFERRLVSDPDDDVRRTVTDLVAERHQLSKIYSRGGQKVETDEERIGPLIERALVAVKYDTMRCHWEELRQQLVSLQATAGTSGDYDFDRARQIMAEICSCQQLCAEMAPLLGERVIEPLRR